MAVGFPCKQIPMQDLCGSILKADNQYFCWKLLRPLQICNPKNDLKILFWAYFSKFSYFKNHF